MCSIDFLPFDINVYNKQLNSKKSKNWKIESDQPFFFFCLQKLSFQQVKHGEVMVLLLKGRMWRCFRPCRNPKTHRFSSYGVCVTSSPAQLFSCLYQESVETRSLPWPWRMLSRPVALMTLTLINGWRWRTHVAVLMRQFVQFCKKTMVVHFIATRLQGCMGTAASFHAEFRPVMNPDSVAPGMGGITARSSVARVVRDSIQMPSLKSASYFINTKSEAANAVAFHILPPGVQKASFGSFYHPVPNITLEEQDCSDASELCVQQCGLAARHMAATE